MLQLYEKIVSRPTVKNVLIPGVISPMPLPLRRNRRRHRLRVPCSECHCQDYYPAPQSYPSKHNPSLHPLVRSKSAVVRSLYKKMRTCPFTRSQTVDENMLRYESPESEYTLYVLNPEVGLGSSYPADCYFERATRYKPREALRASHNFETGSHRRSRSWQDRSTRTRRPGRVKQQHFFDTTSCSRRRAKEATSDWTSSFDSVASHRSHLVPKARSFEDDIIYNNCPAGALGTGRRHPHSESNSSLLSRKARSFEYETVSGNIFSDDSLRTAREKLKKNLSISDSRYGDKIPALKDQSKSYYDSNGETKSKIIADVAKDCFKGSRLTSERARDLRRSRYYFGYDRETSPALDHDLTEFRRFESPIKRSMDALGIIDYESLPEDAFRRKYKHLYYYDVNVESPCDCHLDRSRFQNSMALREDLYGSQEPSEHIYCSIDELMSPTDRYDKYAYLNDPIDRRKWRTSSWEDSLYDGYCYSSRPGSKRRARSTDSYLDAELNHYENWYVEHGDPYTPYRDTCLASYDNEYFDDSGDEFIDYKTQLSADMSRNHTNAQFQSDPYDDPLPHYFSPDEYADRTIHDSRPTHRTDHYFESSSPRRRRKRDRYESYYENVPITSHQDDYSPSFAAQPPMARASSTPILYSDGELESPDYQRRLRLKRRKRNISCPESRDLTLSDEREPLGYDATSPRLFLDSDEEFGSVETVINRPTGVKPAPELGPRRTSYEALWTSWPRREPERYNYARQDYARRRKTSCPECREIEEQYASRRRRHEQDHSHSRYAGQRQRYRRRNSSCPEARELEFFDEEDRERRDVARQHQQQSSKRNVAISDTLEYYEYSMESESQCSENCGFGPSNPRRPRNRAPRPVNANSNIFDSQTATSDTAKNPRATVEHENPASRNHAKPHRSATITPSSGDAFDESSRRRSRKQSTTHDYHDDQLDDDGNNRRSSSMPESSDYASQSSSYEKPSRHELPGNGHAKRGQFSRSFSNTDAPTDEKADGSLSDTAVGLHAEDRSGRGRRSSPGSKSGSGSSSGGTSAVQYQSGMGKKSNSTSQLSATGRKRRLGFGKKGKSSFTVHRSEEVLPEDTASGRSGRQPSSASSDGEGSGDGDSLRVAGESGNLSEFIEGLGPGQLVGRQVVATPSVGDIQLTLRFNKGQLEIEVVRATKLQRKKGTNTTPAPFVKVYLVNGKKCIAKAKTSPARKTLEPLFQQNLTFRENFKGCILQVTVWGDYGRLEGRKVFMGVAQIMLDKLNLNEMVFGWYKLYGTASL